MSALNLKNFELTVVIPAYNEAKRIVSTLKAVESFLSTQHYTTEILVIDDGSTDQTAKIVESLNIPNLRVLNYGSNKGKGYAVNYGIKHAQGQWVLFTDADNSTPISELQKLLSKRETADVIIGSRYLKDSNITLKQPFIRRLLSRAGNVLTQILLLRGIKDTQCGFKLFKTTVAQEIFSKQTIWGWGFDIEILRIAREQKHKIVEVPVVWQNDELSTLRAGRAAKNTLKELLSIKMNSLHGAYGHKRSGWLTLIKFGLVGIIGTALDFAVLNFSVQVLNFDLHTALTLGFLTGMLNNYILNTRWSFRHQTTFGKLIKFALVSVVGLLINNTLVVNLVDNANLHYNLAKFLTVFVVFFWNYTVNKYWTYKEN